MASELLREIFGDHDRQATDDSARLEDLLRQCKDLALRRTTHICASVLRCLIHCIIAKIPLSLPCLSPETIHTIDGEGEEGVDQEKKESPYIWVTKGTLKNLLREAEDYAMEQNSESYDRKFGKIAVYISSRAAAHNQGGRFPHTTALQSYFERSTSFCAHESSKMEGETPDNILTLLDKAVTDDNPLSEYCETHLASYNNELHGSIELKNPFIPEEIVRIRRQGQTFYGISFQAQPKIVLENEKVPKLGRTGPQSLLGKVAYAHEVRGATMNKCQLSMIYTKRTGRVFMKEDHVQQRHPYTFKDISPHNGPTFEELDDGFRISNQALQDVIKKNPDTRGRLYNDHYRSVNEDALLKRKIQLVETLTEITDQDEARIKIWRSIPRCRSRAQEQMAAEALIDFIEDKEGMSKWLAVEQQANERYREVPTKRSEYMNLRKINYAEYLRQRTDEAEDQKVLFRLQQIIGNKKLNAVDREAATAAAFKRIQKITGEPIDRSMLNEIVVELTKKFGDKSAAPEPSEISAAIDAFLGEETLRIANEEPQEVGLDGLRINGEEDDAMEGEEEHEEEEGYGDEELTEYETEDEEYDEYEEEEEDEEEEEGGKEEEEDEEEEEGGEQGEGNEEEKEGGEEGGEEGEEEGGEEGEEEGEEGREEEAASGDDKEAESAEGEDERLRRRRRGVSPPSETTTPTSFVGETPSPSPPLPLGAGEKDSPNRENSSSTESIDVVGMIQDGDDEEEEELMDLGDEPVRCDTPMPTLEPAEGEAASTDSTDTVSAEEVKRNLELPRRITFSLGRYGSVNDLRSKEFFSDLSKLKVDSRAHSTHFLTSCLCSKKTAVKLEVLASAEQIGHHGYILTSYPAVCRHFQVRDDLRSDMYRCHFGEQECTIHTAPNTPLKMHCTRPDDEEHLHFLTTKILKLDSNPSWDAKHIPRVQNLREISDTIRSITSSPNVIKGRMPYEEARSFLIMFNSEGVIESIESGGAVQFRQTPHSRQNPDSKLTPSTEVAFTIKNHNTSWTNPKQTAVTFEAKTTWTTPKDKIALTNSVKLHIPREGETKVENQWRSRPQVKRNTVIVKASPIIIHPVFPESDVMDIFEVDEFILDPNSPHSLQGAEGGDTSGVHAIEQDGEDVLPQLPLVTSAADQVSLDEIEKLKNEVIELKRKMREEKERELISFNVVEEAESGNTTTTNTTTTTSGTKKETVDEILDRMREKGAKLFKDSNSTPKLPSYDASAMSIKTWVDALIEVFSAYPNLGRGVAVSQVILSLKEPQLSSFLMTVDADTDKQKSIQQLLTEFVDRTYVENQTMNAQMFARRSQLPDEPSETYGNTLVTLGRNAFTKTLNNEQIMRRVFERFVSGLREPIGSRVRMQLPENYRQALQIASVVENEFSRGRVNVVENIRNREINRPRYQGRVTSNRTMPKRRDRYNRR